MTSTPVDGPAPESVSPSATPRPTSSSGVDLSSVDTPEELEDLRRGVRLREAMIHGYKKSGLPTLVKLVIAAPFIAAGIGATVAVAGSVGYALTRGETVYQGKVGDTEVKYSEGIYSNVFWTPWTGEYENVLVAKKTGTKVILEDRVGESSIDSMADVAPNYRADRLEKLTIQDSKGIYVIDSDKVVGRTIEDSEAKKLFESANTWYGDMRDVARTEARQAYVTEIRRRGEFFQSPISGPSAPAETP